MAISNEVLLNNLSPETDRSQLGKRIRQLLDMAILQAGGTGIVYAITLSNSTTALSFTAFNYFVNGAPARKAAGTQALTATTDDVAQDKWASFRVSIAAGGTVTITRADDVDTEAEAHANLADVPANEADMGYFVVRGGTGAAFDATTTNLQTGAIAGMVVKFFPATPVFTETIDALK